MSPPIRVLVIDDSLVMRNLLSRNLGADPDLEVVGTACDPYAARDAIVEMEPDVLTLDIEMPRMDGVTFLRKLMPQHPIPTVMVSSLTVKGGEKTLEALSVGAVDFVSKPMNGSPEAVAALIKELRAKVKAAAKVDVTRLRSAAVAERPPLAPTVQNKAGVRAIAIGASTGGVEALSTIIPKFGPGVPPILIVQHMPKEFTPILARRLQDRSNLRVREAVDGELIASGTVFIAPGGTHLSLTGRAGELRTRLEAAPPVSGHCPSVDVLFRSVAERVGPHAVGVLLTGMGRDGAEGLLAMRKMGAKTLVQDQQTSVVYGMPQAAVALGAAQAIRPLDDVPVLVTRWLGDAT